MKTRKKIDPRKALKKHFKANLTPTKFNLLNQFENEYKEAMVKDSQLTVALEDDDKTTLRSLFNNCDQEELDMILSDEDLSATPFTDKVVDKFMNMDTDLFDSDDLNTIIDKYDGYHE